MYIFCNTCVSYRAGYWSFPYKTEEKTDRPFTTRSQENIPERGRGLQKTWTSPEKLPFQAGGSR